MEISGAGARRAAGGVADFNGNVIDDSSELNLKILFVLPQERPRLLVLYDRPLLRSSAHRPRGDQGARRGGGGGGGGGDDQL